MWWGDREATIQYCKDNLPRICEEFGGDISNIFICGFSRGAIACSYIGLADDEIASFWKGMITHDHFDGQKNGATHRTIVLCPQADCPTKRQTCARLRKTCGLFKELPKPC